MDEEKSDGVLEVGDSTRGKKCVGSRKEERGQSIKLMGTNRSHSSSHFFPFLSQTEKVRPLLGDLLNCSEEDGVSMYLACSFGLTFFFYLCYLCEDADQAGANLL